MTIVLRISKKSVMKYIVKPESILATFPLLQRAGYIHDMGVYLNGSMDTSVCVSTYTHEGDAHFRRILTISTTYILCNCVCVYICIIITSYMYQS